MVYSVTFDNYPAVYLFWTAYSEKLKESDNKVEVVTIKGVPHGFWSLSGIH